MKKVLKEVLVDVTNYSEFKPLPIQREIYPAHVKDLVKSFERTGCCFKPSILLETSVYDGVPTLYLADGTQRQRSGDEVLKKGGEPIPMDFMVYQIFPDTEENIGIYFEEINSHQKNLALKDYLPKNKAIGTNQKDYEYYNQQREILNIKDGYLIRILSDSCSVDEFKNGKFKTSRDKKLLKTRVKLFREIPRQKKTGTYGLPKGNGYRKFLSCILLLDAPKLELFIDILKEYLPDNPFNNDEEDIKNTVDALLEKLYVTEEED